MSCKAVGSCFEDEIAANVFPFENVPYMSMFYTKSVSYGGEGLLSLSD